MNNENIHFKLKRILFNNEIKMICLQNKNGPCPLLSIVVNAYLTLQFTSANVEHQECDQQKTAVPHLSSIINTFSGLGDGLNIDVRFDGPKSFEPTEERAIFEFCNIKLYHGWIPDADDHRNLFICSKSYNQIVQSIAEVNSKEDLNRFDVNQNSAEYEMIQDIMSWFSETSTQLTYCGLIMIYQSMEENELGVFFRNDHFSVIHKHEDVLYLLVTDQGYLTQPTIVWEKLDSVTGDCTFVDSNFQEVVCDSDYVNMNDDVSKQIQVDEELTKKLQLEEDEVYSKYVQNEFKNSSSSSSDEDLKNIKPKLSPREAPNSIDNSTNSYSKKNCMLF